VAVDSISGSDFSSNGDFSTQRAADDEAGVPIVNQRCSGSQAVDAAEYSTDFIHAGSAPLSCQVLGCVTGCIGGSWFGKHNLMGCGKQDLNPPLCKSATCDVHGIGCCSVSDIGVFGSITTACPHSWFGV
jgi:hypothetical protein